MIESVAAGRIGDRAIRMSDWAETVGSAQTDQLIVLSRPRHEGGLSYDCFNTPVRNYRHQTEPPGADSSAGAKHSVPERLSDRYGRGICARRSHALRGTMTSSIRPEFSSCSPKSSRWRTIAWRALPGFASPILSSGRISA
jgi:hypothetical protein